MTSSLFVMIYLVNNVLEAYYQKYLLADKYIYNECQAKILQLQIVLLNLHDVISSTSAKLSSVVVVFLSEYYPLK